MGKIIEVLFTERKFIIFLFQIFRIGIIKSKITRGITKRSILLGIWRFDFELGVSFLKSHKAFLPTRGEYGQA